MYRVYFNKGTFFETSYCFDEQTYHLKAIVAMYKQCHTDDSMPWVTVIKDDTIIMDGMLSD